MNWIDEVVRQYFEGKSLEQAIQDVADMGGIDKQQVLDRLKQIKGDGENGQKTV